MCQGTEGRQERKRVIISGAGPSGLLLTALLLNKNKQSNSGVTYEVTLVDGREDYGAFTKEELTKNHRSWMLALADHGMDAIKTVPNLYEKYIKGEGVKIEQLDIYFGSKKMTNRNEDANLEAMGVTHTPENFVVDRNFVVAALARFVRENHANDEFYTPMYRTKCMYVDYENKRVLVRNIETEEEFYVPYDLLVGSDGVRSTVREAFVKRHSNFSCDYTDIFQEFKPVHVQIPKGVSSSAMGLLPDIFPYCQGICLPETGGLVNIGIGTTRNHFEKLPEELKSDDYKVVAEYVKANFKAFELHDYDDFAKQWVNQRWNQTGMVHCNFYHSLETSAVIMGDAAHATSPSIGMGMNTALRDAQIFSEILEETENDFTKALPAFSKARVKEGNALSDLAMHLYCMDKTQQLKETIHQVVRTTLFFKIPRFFDEHPFTMIGRRGVSLSDTYERAVKLGIIGKHRAINDKIRQEYFENITGMVSSTPNTTSWLPKLLFGTSLVAVGAAFAFQKMQMQ